MYKRYALRLGVILAATGCTGLSLPYPASAEITHASDMPVHGVNPADRQFLQQAADDSAAEVAMAQLALKQASKPEVKQLAQQLLDDHMQMIRDMVKLTNLKQDAQPAEPTPADRQEQQRLQGLHGNDFDEAYIRDMVQAHQRAVELYAKAARNSADADIRQYAQGRLPMLQHHLAMARKLAGDAP